jgi:hypothetical protein
MQEIVEREHPVAIHDLERCVRRYWDEQEGDDQRPLYRALTMNLIAVAPAADESLLRATFHRLLRSSPCLAFLVLTEPGDAPLQASFGTHVQCGRNARTVLLEQVTFRAARREQRKVPSLIRPLVVDDLPTQLFWSGPLPADLELFQALGALADQIVYDSTLFADPDRDARRVEATSTRTIDLTWLRLKPWRRALAEAFEHVRWQRGQPTAASIRCANSTGTRAASARLAHWLTERLGARVELIASPRSDAPSFEPCAVEVRTGDSTVLVEHRWPSPTLRVSTTLADRCLLPFSTVSRCQTRGDLLATAAESLGVAGAATGGV